MADIQRALRQFNSEQISSEVEAAERERAEILRRFPLERWPDMSLADYALGQNRPNDWVYCWWLEFGSTDLGSVRGGSATKHLIYKKKDGSWFHSTNYPDEQTAWAAIRDGFVEMFGLAQEGRWNEIDGVEAISNARAIRLKSLHVYFPDQIFPIGSVHHIRRFLDLLDVDTKSISVWQAVKLNRMLLEKLREYPETQRWSTIELMYFLYSWADPREENRAPQIFKIAPGEEGRYWDDCLKNGYIRVGWAKVGDLREFENEADFRAKFAEAFGDEYHENQALIRRKGDEVWTLRNLVPGDKIIANRGMSTVLGIGTVVEPGYEWLPEPDEYNHIVRVQWDLTHAGEKDLPSSWRFAMVAPVSQEVYQRIIGATDEQVATLPSSPLFGPIADALERKGQVILYGPPGTGKTYHARRFAQWWLTRENGHPFDPDKAKQIPSQVWWVVANPRQWQWDQLFRDGSVEYRYGRVKGNYPQVQEGDLVVGYLAAPRMQVVALARVKQGLHGNDGEQTITLEPVCPIDSGLTYEELINDDTLRYSEPARLHCQGTLFKLERDEADYLFSLLEERDPKLAEYLEENDTDVDSISQLTLVTFHPSYSYEDFIEGFRPQEGSEGLRLRLDDGLFKRVCIAAAANPEHKYLIIVDEINRANLAKVFGEIITLLERDKRGISLVLPQSKKRFSVPKNIYMLGTMNTADRSIRLMDAALRRRFSFIEIMPDLALLRGAQIDEVLHLDDFLTVLNNRISRTQGREKQIGHAFFLEKGQPMSDGAVFAQCFRQEVLPLLQEYCYDDYGQLGEYVGKGLVDVENSTLRTDVLYDDDMLVAALAEFTSGASGSM